MLKLLLANVVLLVWAVGSVKADFNLTVLHTNDVHCRFDESNKYGSTCTAKDAAAGKCFGGYARIVQKLRELRQQNPNAIYLHGGDFFQGTLWYTIHKWKVVSHFTNFLNLTAMSLGNHEFDDGIDGLTPFVERANFPVLAANIDTTSEPRIDGRVLPSITIEVEGRRIGIIGYVTPETLQISSPEGVKIYDEIEGIRKEAWKLKRSGVDILIAVGHSGYLKDLEIAEKVEIIDLVVGGHTNTFLWNGPEPSIEESQGPYPTMVVQPSGRKVPVVQAYAFGKYIGNLEITFDDDGEVIEAFGQPIILDNSVAQAEDILEELVPWRAKIEGLANKEVGKTRVFLDGSRLACRMRECNLGNLITDAFIDQFIKYSPDDQWGKVAIAIVNGGGIRDSIDERSRNGSITYGDLRAVAPFPNTVDLVRISGDTLYKLFEFAVRDYDVSALDPFGGFLQVSGLKIVYDLSQPPNERVVQLMARCSQCRIPTYDHVLRNETYDIATTSFIAGGGDGNNAIRDNIIEHQILGILDSDAIVGYMAKNQPIITGTEHRIRFKREMTSSPCSSRRVDMEESESRPSGASSNLNLSPNVNLMVLLLSAWWFA